MLRAEERVESGPQPEPPPDGADGRDPLDPLIAHLADVAAQVSRLARIRAARTRLRLRRVAFAAFGGILGAIVAVTASVAGVRLFARGLVAGLTDLLDGRVWVAEMWTGLFLLAGTALVLVSILAWSERRLLRDLERRQGAGRAPR